MEYQKTGSDILSEQTQNHFGNYEKDCMMGNLYVYNSEGGLIRVSPCFESLGDFIKDEFSVKMSERVLRQQVEKGEIMFIKGHETFRIRVRLKHEAGTTLDPISEQEHQKMDFFEKWWFSVGSGMSPKGGDDIETHTKKVVKAFWKALK